jgi:glucan endo-1,3-beta-D-glucosidase
MYTKSGLLALAAYISAVTAVSQGFNYGSTHTDGSAKTQQDFSNAFAAAKKLAGTNGAFTSARLYTMIQAGTTDDVIEAIPAAVASGTRLLLGLWASGGDTVIDNEINALTAALKNNPGMAKLVDGISVGSEDLYRISNLDPKKEVGATAEVVASYITKVKKAISSIGLKDVPVGHVDTFTSWVDNNNKAVVDAADFLGMDAYPYFQNTMPNSIGVGKGLFDSALEQTKSFSQGKPVWVTETGWPISGPLSGAGVANTANAKKYWDEVGCGELFGKVNTWWYTIQDADPTTPSPSFGLLGASLSGKPAYDLSCPAGSSSSSASASATKGSSDTTSVSANPSATETMGSPANSQSDAADSTKTAAGGSGSKGSSSKTAGSAPYPTAGSGSGSSGSANGTLATTAGAGSPTKAAGAAGASGSSSGTKASSTAISTGGAAATVGSIAAVFGAMAVAVLFM